MKNWFRSISNRIDSITGWAYATYQNVLTLYTMSKGQKERDERILEALRAVTRQNEAIADGVLSVKETQANQAQELQAVKKLATEILSAVSIPPATHLVFTLTELDGSNPQTPPQGADMSQKATLPDNTEDKLVKLTPTDDGGFAAPIDGDATFTSSDETKIKVEKVAGDPIRARLTFLDKTPGQSPVTITATADADLGEGAVTISESIDIDFSPGQATHLGLTLEAVPAEPAPDEGAAAA